MKNNKINIHNSGAWVGVGAAIGVAIYAITNELTWIAVGVAVGAALSWRKPKKVRSIIYLVIERSNLLPSQLLPGGLKPCQTLAS